MEHEMAGTRIHDDGIVQPNRDEGRGMNVVDLHGVTQARTSPEARAIAAQLLSDRHRGWGYDCPAVDLDFVVYDKGLPIALIEYKNEHGAPLNLAIAGSPFRPLGVLLRMANRATLPFFICRYAADFTAFKTRAMNDLAKAVLPETTLFDEVGFVHFLYRLGERKRRVPQYVRDYLKGQGRLDF
jgi:hypothetical protein